MIEMLGYLVLISMWFWVAFGVGLIVGAQWGELSFERHADEAVALANGWTL